LSRGAAITDVQHLLGHASVKTTERAYAAFVKNAQFKQTIDLLDRPVAPKLKIVKYSVVSNCLLVLMQGKYLSGPRYEKRGSSEHKPEDCKRQINPTLSF
jgi:hypothetical protein